MFRSPHFFRVSAPYRSIGGVVLLVLMVSIPACRAETETRSPSGGAVLQNGDEVLQRMVAAYGRTMAYSDQAELTLRYRLGGRLHEETVPFAVHYRRPNRLHAAVYQVRFSGNEQHFWARIEDEATGNLDGQILQRRAPDRLTLDDLTADLLVQDSLTGGLAGFPVQLELLFSPRPLLPVFSAPQRPRLLESQVLDGRECYRVSCRVDGVEFLFWVDRQDFLLRRMEYPTDALARSLARLGTVEEITLVADFHDARFEVSEGESPLAWHVADEELRVRHFVIPPQPLPTDKLGEAIDEFTLPAEQDDSWTRSRLQGKVTVMVWFNDHPASRQTLAQLQAVRAQFDDGAVQFLTIYADAENPTIQHARDLQNRWQVNLPLALDRPAVGRDVFQVREAPTLVILDKQGRLQIFEERVNPYLHEQLPHILDRLLEGEDLAALVLRQQRHDQARYDHQLASARIARQDEDAARAPRIAAPFDAQHLQLRQVWNQTELQAAGQVLHFQHQGQTRLLALDGWRSVVELDDRGEIVQRVALSLPEGVGVNRLVARQTPHGPRFATYTRMGKQVFVFDEAWQPMFRYPDDDAAQQAIHDVLMNPQSETLLAIAFESQGMHGVSPTGKLLWNNRDFPSVVSLAPGEAGIWAVGDRGTIRSIDGRGRGGPQRRLPGWTLQRLHAMPFAKAHSTYCGISHDETGRPVIVALNEQLQEMWSYPLTTDAYAAATVLVDALLVAGQPMWVFAAPDGTIHFVSHDGQLADYLAHGQAISGLAALHREGQSRLVISNESGIESFDVHLPSQLRSARKR